MGRFTLRLPETLHQQLEVLAQEEGVSLNQYLVYTLAQHTAPAYTIQIRSPQEIAERRVKFDALLGRLRGETETIDIDDILAQREIEAVDEESAELVAKMRAKMTRLKSQHPTPPPLQT